MTITERHASLLAEIREAVLDSSILERDLVTVSHDGGDYERAKSPAAGGIILYPMPRISRPGPRVYRLTWTIAVICDRDDILARMVRIEELLGVLRDNRLFWSGDEATQTDFKLTDREPITGYTITHIEEHNAS